MNKAEVEARREAMTFAFLNDFEGSSVVAETSNTAVIRTGGMTPEQRRMHKQMIFCTFGLWLPVYWIVRLLRRPGGVIIIVDRFTGEVTIQELA
jgi:hypothetical protein